MNTRNKKKSITVVSGLDGFKVKLSEVGGRVQGERACGTRH
jgi:translation initiation factor 1 (eIF-1/SUI1)